MTPSSGTRLDPICVYCGSSDSIRPAYLDAARAMGTALASRGQTVVFGGGRTGMMGALADAALLAGGRVVGVLPEQFDTEVLAHRQLSELRIVPSMHARKALMAEMGAAFVALPGGYGTFEELFEILTWAQIGMHRRPVGVLNALGYFDPLLELVEHARREGFIYAEHRGLFVSDTEPGRLLDRLQEFVLPEGLGRWVDRR